MKGVPFNPGDPRAIALRAGDRDFNGPRMFFAPAPIILGPNRNGEVGTATYVVQVPTPDSRCRVKVTVAFFATGADGADGSGTIWIAACDQDQKGISGSTGKIVPVTDVEGHQGTPTPFPQDPGLQGYSRSFVTASDYLQVTISISSGQATPGFWAVQTRIQPNAVTLTWDEWDEIRRLFLPTRTA